MKAVILAGGTGSRLAPVTVAVNKHLLPIYNKPMIYYPLSLAMLCGIRDVLFIVNPQDKTDFVSLFSDGSSLGMRIEYAEQPKPRGLAEGLLLAEDFLQGDSVCYMLGDNVFFGHDLVNLMQSARKEIEENKGAYVFGYNVKDPGNFGILEFDDKGNVLSIEEKPDNPKSNYAVVGMYFYDKNAVNYAKKVLPSDRGEIEITSVNSMYLQNNQLRVKLLGRGFAWFDAGTHESFLEAGKFVATIENKTGLMIGCIEEIAYRNGWIDFSGFKSLIEKLSNTDYGQYLLEVVSKEGI